jgi:hypothetical protein
MDRIGHHHVCTKQKIINLGKVMGAKVVVDRTVEEDPMVTGGRFNTKETYADVKVRNGERTQQDLR